MYLTNLEVWKAVAVEDVDPDIAELADNVANLVAGGNTEERPAQQLVKWSNVPSDARGYRREWLDRAAARTLQPCPQSNGSRRFPALAEAGDGDHRRDGPGHDPVPHCRSPGLLGRLGPGRPPVRPPRPQAGQRRGNAYLKGYCTQAATGARTTGTFPGERLRRLSRRIGGNRARSAVGRSILVVIIGHLLASPEARFTDLGPDWHARAGDRDGKIRARLRQL